MNLIFKGFSAVLLSLGAATTFAAPEYLTTHNNTSEESNAYIAGAPSLYPTPANTTKKVFWNLVKMACYGHTTNGKCSASIKMATNTPDPIDIADVTLDLNSGTITVVKQKNYNYTFTINGPGEATIDKR
ncbi:hypothetical protein [Legionella longbeachae]|uniref:Uncharacterized protein n=1 Tax=Legionella longbeachae serogroup 1 (strain NSW150) TaxID=661367 RepID=D3HRD2_LEGLN|nr:hypothetical protein [Legionella longbeachae]VEE01965.1 Uncharacterised protein [Legionella oakridgensis]HBD7396783.1 hypothetical protein [Legionella pneumophila]ARB91724.1 hypothetical protein A6J40_05800 [Legionella longbeachae]ARM35131.1 hypothetical protein B0B39_17155 [Legionella longbeachae]EEZ95429.1 conserved hypothetical protein [Legionella longbeachae D-4968]